MPTATSGLKSASIAPEITSYSWPNFLGPHHNSQSAETDVCVQWPPSGPPVLWRQSIGTGYSSPVVDGGRVYVTHRIGDQEIVSCFDAATGQSAWRSASPTSYDCPVAYSDGPYSTPSISQGRCFAIGAQARLRCLDATTGDLVWERLLQSEFRLDDGMFPVSTSPYAWRDLLIVNVGGSQGSGVVALEQATGKVRWSVTDDAASYATPVCETIHGEELAFVFTHDGLICLAPDTGRLLWKIPYRPKNPETIIASSPLVYEDLVFASGYQLGALCVRVGQGGQFEELWREQRVLDSQYNNMVCCDGLLFGFSAIDKSLRCVDAMSGKLLWKWRSKLGRGNMVAADGHLLILGQEGHLGSVRMRANKADCVSLTSEPVLEGPCFAAPALCNGLLYLRNESEIVCVDLRAGHPPRR
jgi:outer membrane protein assembly factor BamB